MTRPIYEEYRGKKLPQQLTAFDVADAFDDTMRNHMEMGPLTEPSVIEEIVHDAMMQLLEDEEEHQ